MFWKRRLSAPTASSASAASATTDRASAAPAAAVRLDELRQRQCGLVQGIQAPEDDAARLKVMGICSGRKVQLVKRGDPLIVRVLGSRLGLSLRLAHQIVVEPCNEPGCQGDPSSDQCIQRQGLGARVQGLAEDNQSLP